MIATKAIKVGSIIVTFNLVALAWLFFRAQGMAEAIIYLKGIILLQGHSANDLFYFWRLSFFVGLVLMIDIPQYLKNDHTVMLEWPWVLKGLIYGCMVIIIILLAPENEMPFIYFQF